MGVGTPWGALGCVANTGVINAGFGSVAMTGLTGEFLDVWQGKELENRGQGIGSRLGRGLGRKWAVFSGW